MLNCPHVKVHTMNNYYLTHEYSIHLSNDDNSSHHVYHNVYRRNAGAVGCPSRRTNYNMYNWPYDPVNRYTVS